MELQQFRYFLTAARYQHMTRAAAELNIAQPALSQSIRRLENELGVELFNRENHHVILNENGQFLVKKLVPILSAIDNLSNELQIAKDSSDHTIRLCLLESSSMITRCIAEYKDLHPDIHFILSQSFDTESADIIIAASQPDEATFSSGSDSHVILEEEFQIAVSSHSPLAVSSSISLRDLAATPFVALDTTTSMRSTTGSFCMRAAISPPVVFECDDAISLRNLVASDIGIAFWPRISWSRIVIPEITLLPIDDLDCRRDLTVILNKNGRRNPIASDFYHHLITSTSAHGFSA